MVDFSQLKKNRKSEFDKLNSALTKLSSQGNKDEERFWKPTTDKAGNGIAVIRFLPAPANEDVPFVRLWDHGFQGPGGWYIENSLTTLGEQDPVGEYNGKLWNSGVESDKEIARKQKRRLHFISNIYVVSDPGNPDNNGKVFLFKYGKKIFDKINDVMNPSFQDEKPINPFDLWEGADFKLKIRQVEGYRNYDKSEFADSAPLAKDDDALEAIWKQEHSLQAFLDPKNFKSYAELAAKLNRVLGITTGSKSSPKTTDDDEDVEKMMERVETKTAAAKAAPTTTAPWDDEEEDMKFFENLANKNDD